MSKPATVTDPTTQGLPAVNTSSTKRDGQAFFLASGIEQLTRDLHQGRAVSADAVRAAELLIQRAEALKNALEMRKGKQVVLVDDDAA